MRPRLAAGMERRVAEAPRKKRRARTYRKGPPTQRVLYLPTFLASVTLPRSRVPGAEFKRVNGDIQLSLLAPEEPGLPYGTAVRARFLDPCVPEVDVLASWLRRLFFQSKDTA